MSVSLQIDASDIVAGLALLIAAYSAWKTVQFNKRQTAFEETNERLNLLLIEREASESEAAKRADVSANFYKAGHNKYRLKVFNKGKGAARNVRFEALDGADLFIENDIARKFPVPVMEQHASVELIAAVHMGSPSRAHIKLIWDDDTGQAREKELHPTW
jgi:hypothetical protein